MYKYDKYSHNIRNLLDSLNRELDTTVESTSELEKRSRKITQVASERLSMVEYERVGQRQKKIE